SSLVAGYPEEVEAFGKRNRAFVESLDSLVAALNAVFVRDWSTTSTADPVIFYLGRRCVDDFLEILLLSANGHAAGASALLRGLYERAVTAAFLHVHPDEASDFVDYDLVQRRKLARAIAGLPDMNELPSKELEALEVQFQAVRERFEVSCCPKCKTKRLNHTWNNLDLVSMARETPRLKKLIVPAYLVPLSHAHSTLKSISSKLEEAGGHLSWKDVPDHADIDWNLRMAHCVLLQVLATQIEHFELKGEDEVIDRALSAYRDAWGMQTHETTD
ncbi:MAG: DUF5677 domain-containing protein, partial [Coriobacteriia bacterium]|nr:DUF5677 domain-containing protein [Coriobacteriia bacterium]